MLIFTASKNAPKEVDIRALQFEEKDRLERLQYPRTNGPQPAQRTFTTVNTYCGYWTFSGTQLIFSPQYRNDRQGKLLFGEDSAALILAPSSPMDSEHRIDIAYHTIDSVVLGHQSDPTITFALLYAPKLFELPNVTDKFANVGLARTSQPRQLPKTRLESLDAHHSQVARTCWVYRVMLDHSQKISIVSNLLKANRKVLSHVSMTTNCEKNTVPFATQLSTLENALQTQSVPFTVKFQVHRLSTNGCT